jgi:D-glycero-beta-D-manno-heptose 1-phosphate adenylyltransferase
MGRLVTARALTAIRTRLRRAGRRVVFTNGTFDIIHRGHVDYLIRARRMGDVLIVGLNTDASIRRIKGTRRPINPNADRAAVLAALIPVDYVCFFSGDTPERLIRMLVPDVLVKGADWPVDAIVGKDIVKQRGGVVRTVRLTPGRSTTGTIGRVLAAYGCTDRARRRPR